MSTVLVTGGAGYIGSHTCKALKAAGFDPVTLDDLSTGHAHAVKWGPLVRCNLLDSEKLSSALHTHQPIAVLHFAGRLDVKESTERPDLYYQTNVVGSLSLLEAVRTFRTGLLPLVFSSTAATYGTPQEGPIRETHPQLPINPYGASKLAVERMLEDYRQAFGLKSTSLRYFNAAGADPDGEIGEDHDPEPHVIPRLFWAAQNGEPFTVNGTDYPTPDGSCVRDYVHVSDLADAHVLALKRLLNGDDGAAFNLGTNQGTSVFELIREFQKHSPSKVSVTTGPRRQGDPSSLVADSSLARTRLGWTPRFGIQEIIKSAWDWHQRRGHGVKRTKADRTKD